MASPYEEFNKPKNKESDPYAEFGGASPSPQAPVPLGDQPATISGTLRSMPGTFLDVAKGALKGLARDTYGTLEMAGPGGMALHYLAEKTGLGQGIHKATEPSNDIQRMGGYGETAATMLPMVEAGASKLIGGARSLLRVDPRIAINRSLRPTPSDPTFPERIPQALSTIKAANPNFKPAVEDGQLNLIPAANKAIRLHQEALNPWMTRMEGTRIPGAPIVEATRKATGGMLPSEHESAQGLIDRARQDYQNFSPAELRARLSLLNERLSPFYAQSPARQSSALADIPYAVLKAQRDAVADTLYRHLDPENAGAGPRLIQSRTGDLIDLRDAAARRNNAIVAEQPLTPLGRVVDPLKGLLRHFIPGSRTGAGLAFAEGSEGRSLPMLRRAFNAINENEGANELGMLPKPGPRLIGAPADTSGSLPHAVADFRNAGAENPRAPRALLTGATPGHKEPLITPPPADTSGPTGIRPTVNRGIGLAAGNRTLPAPKQVPQGGFATGTTNDLVPFKHPVTGQIEYVPKWMIQGHE